MRYFLVTFILLSFGEAFGARSFEEPIYCVMSEESRATESQPDGIPFPPISDSLTVEVDTIDGRTPVVRSPDLEQFLSGLNMMVQDLYPRDCIVGFIDSIKSQVVAQCQAIRRSRRMLDCSSTGSGNPIDTALQSFNRQIASNAQVGERVRANPEGLVMSTIFPMETLAEGLATTSQVQSAVTRLNNHFRRTCDLNFYDSDPLFGGNDLSGIVLTRDFMENRVFPFINSSAGRRCRGPVLEFYSDFLRRQESACAGGQSTLQCHRFRTASHRTVAWLSRLRAIDYNPDTVACGLMTTTEPYELMRETIDAVAGQIACQPLAIDGTRIGLEDRHNQGYLLRRTASGAFEVSFRLKFSPSSMQRTMEAGMRRCFETANPLMTGTPRGNPNLLHGSQLTFKVSNDPLVPEGEVTMQQGAHPTERTWPTDIDCPTMIHELFHHMGLHDTYHDTTGPNGTSRYPCRQESHPYSIMNDHYYAFEKVQMDGGHLLSATQLRRILYPGCRSGDGHVNNESYYQCTEYAYMTPEQCQENPVDSSCESVRRGL